MLSGAATLGTGTLVAEGGTGLRIVGGTPIALTNGLQILSASSFTFNTAETDLAMTGPIDWQASLVV